MIGTKYKAFFDKLFEPVARKAIAFGLSPNQLTLLGLAFGLGTCFLLILTRNLFLFAVLILVTGLIDAIDGLVARLTAQTSRFGAYLDAMCDRYFEAAALFSAAWVTGYWKTAFLVVVGAMLTSYAKSRAAMEVSVSNREWPDLMERGERSAIFVIGIILSQFLPAGLFGRDIFFWTLMFLAVGTNATAIQRIFRAKKIIAERSEKT